MLAGIIVLTVATAAFTAQGPPQPPSGPPPPGDRGQAPEAEGVVAFPGGVVWEGTLPEQPAFRPAFDGSRMFVAMKDKTLVAITLETGVTAWTEPQPSSVPPTVAGTLVVGADGASLWARDAASGATKWASPLDAEAILQVGATTDTVCSVTASGRLSCVAASDGTPRWQQDLGAKPSAGLLVAGGRVVVGFADGAVRAFGLDKGAPLWTHTTKGAVLTLSATDTRVIAGTDANFVFALDAKKGSRKWKWRTGGDPVGDAIVVGKRLIYVAYDNTLRAHNIRNGHMAWDRVLVSRPVGGPVSIGDRVLVASVAPQLRAFKVIDGTPDGVVALPGKVIHQPYLVAAAGDVPPMVVVVTGGGQMQAIGQTIEPAVVPLETLPGARLIAETVRR
jgi:outer membrane protein assembly factor BamB